MCTADLGFTGGKNDIGAGTDTDFAGACTPALNHPRPHHTALQRVIAILVLPPGYLFSLYLRKNTFEVLSAVLLYM